MAGSRNPDLIDFYSERIAEHGYSYEAMWGDAAAWKSDERFRPLTAMPIAPGDVVVDIGCGTGDLAAFLKAHDRGVTYIGVEAVTDFAQRARELTGCEIVEIDAFRCPELLPAADWYVTFGTINKSWSLTDLEGEDDTARIRNLLAQLYSRARKGIAASLVTDVVDYRKPGVANVDPAEMAAHLKQLTPHFMVFHGYRFFEFFVGAWRGERR